MSDKNYANKLPNITKKQPIKQASLSKFVEAKREKVNIDYLSQAQPIVSSISKKIKHNEEIMRLFPDTELPIQILTSSIISPNDMVSITLNYLAPNNLSLTQDIKSTLISTIKEYISTEYSLEDRLYDDVKEALFTKGASIMVVIPESALDDIINQAPNISFESMVDFYNQDINKKKSILSKKSYISDSKFGNQTFNVENLLGVNLTENLSILKLKDIKLNNISMECKNKYGSISVEDDNKELLNQLFRPVSEYKTLKTARVNTDDHSTRKSVDKPLVLNLPVESVIPVHVKNNPDKHLGYFIAIDETGVPITSDYIDESTLTATTDLSNSINSESGDTKLSMISRARAELYGMTKQDPKLQNMNEVYDKILESYLNTIIKDGEIGDIGTISKQFDLYRVMMRRALSNQQTNLLFVPAELTSYMTFDYRENGTGRSFLEKTAILYSLRGILFVSRALANVRNYTGMSSVEVEMGDNIPNPKAVQETVISEFLKTRESAFPLGISRVDDIVNYIHRVGYRFNFKHIGLADISINQSDEQPNKVIPDSDFDEYIYSLILMSFGLTPEIVQSGIESDFATTFSAKSMLFAKRVTALQGKLNTMLTDRVRKLLSYDPIIKHKLKKIVAANLTDIKSKVKTQLTTNTLAKEELTKLNSLSDATIINHLVNTFISEITVHLPKIETIEVNGNKQAFEDYKTVLTEALDVIFDESKLSEEVIGPIANKLPMLKAIIGSVGINKWLTENNYLPEISQFLTKDEDGKPVFNIMGDFTNQLENLYDAFFLYFKPTKKMLDEMSDKMSKIEEDSNDDTDNTDDDSNDTTDDNKTDDNDNNDDNDDSKDSDDNTTDGGDEPADGDDPDDMFEGFGEPDEGGDGGSKGSSELDDELKKAKIKKELSLFEKHKAEAIKTYSGVKNVDGVNVSDKIAELDKLDDDNKDDNQDDDSNDDGEFNVDEV